MKVNHEHLLTHFTAVKEAPFVYYTGAAWDKADIITNAQNWFSYLQLFQQQLQLPLQLKLL
jgi:hypothetical protein